jgi:hypothetical protein
MIIKTDHGTIKSDKEGFLLKNGDTVGREIRLGDWDSEENYIEVPEEEYYTEVPEEE